jgi:predicted RNA-binding protein YlqC (UPF0109 family)
MDAYLESIVRPLLSKPESFKVSMTTDNMGVLLTVDVALEDMSHLIGKEGQNITSIRRIVGLYGMRNNAKISLKVNEPVGGKRHV